jgi:hypothetical protein
MLDRARAQQDEAIEHMRRDEARMKNECDDAAVELCACSSKPIHACEGCDDRDLARIVQSFRPAPMPGRKKASELPMLGGESFDTMGKPEWLQRQEINMTIRGAVHTQDSDRDEVEASERGGVVIVSALIIGAVIAGVTLLAWFFYDVLERLLG